MRRFVIQFLVAASLTGPALPVVRAQVGQKRTLTIQGAKAVAAAVFAEAKRVNAPGGAVAIVDEGGALMYAERLDGTFAAAGRICIGKARTAAAFRKPTSVFEKIIKDGRTPMLAIDDFTPLQGGVPIVVEGEIVGALGVSGAASAQQDEELAVAGAAAVTATDSSESIPEVTYIDNTRVSEAFKKGEPLVKGDGRNFMVHASRRDTPGMAEVHAKDTDIFHVLEGSATIVTGGSLVEPTELSSDDEFRAGRIDGGKSRKLTAGDVIVIPAGVPHWFSEVQSPMTYYVVKVRS